MCEVQVIRVFWSQIPWTRITNIYTIIFSLLFTLMSLYFYLFIFFYFGLYYYHPLIINLLFYLPFYAHFSHKKKKKKNLSLSLYIYIYIFVFYSSYSHLIFFKFVILFHILSWKNYYSLSLSLSLGFLFFLAVATLLKLDESLCFLLILSRFNMFWCSVLEFLITGSLSPSYSFDLIFIWVNS